NSFSVRKENGRVVRERVTRAGEDDKIEVAIIVEIRREDLPHGPIRIRGGDPYGEGGLREKAAGVRHRAGIAQPIQVPVRLLRVRSVGTVVAQIADSIPVAVVLIRDGHERAVVTLGSQTVEYGIVPRLSRAGLGHLPV